MSTKKLNEYRYIGYERNKTTNTAGVDNRRIAGGATIGATDKDGGSRIHEPGVSTGTGKCAVRDKRYSRAASTGTADNVLLEAVIIPSEKNLTDNVATTLFEVALPTLAMAAGRINYHICVTDGTDMQSHSNNIHYAMANKGGTYTKNFTTPPTAVEALTAGTLSVAWSFVEGTNKITIAVTVDTSLASPTSMKFYYTLDVGGVQAITQL